ncbi:hypothetical protein D0T90_08525 [Neisseria animalis]|uniref:Uncharacterized protein n=1 Tax=Neisseria animalis TaxID=492 RepID=A0A5P3MSL0_NEIAN|nr:hypothetical protein D0T90_08525 [Neisseria animalis]
MERVRRRIFFIFQPKAVCKNIISAICFADGLNINHQQIRNAALTLEKQLFHLFMLEWVFKPVQPPCRLVPPDIPHNFSDTEEPS